METMRKHLYKTLGQRIERERKMFVISQKIQTRKDLQVRSTSASAHLCPKAELTLLLCLSIYVCSVVHNLLILCFRIRPRR